MENQKLINVANFSSEELRKWQLKLLEILVYFKQFCDAHNLRFYLAAGTALGAVRHKGFIPWDDDLDVQMPRDDYDKLIELWNKEADTSRFECCVTTKEKCSRFPMATIRSVNTTCIYDHSVNDDICQGMKIDVEFLDGVPQEKLNRQINFYCARVLALLRAERVPNRKSIGMKLLSKAILIALPSHALRWKVSCLLENRIKKYKFNGNNEYVRYLSCALRPKESFDSVVYVDFEGHQMPIPIGYDAMLKAAYGDYMQFPPENKRKPVTDNLVFYDLEHSYLDYKGKYYCVNKK